MGPCLLTASVVTDVISARGELSELQILVGIVVAIINGAAIARGWAGQRTGL